MHCFRIARSASAVRCDCRVARQPWRTLLPIEPESEPCYGRVMVTAGLWLRFGYGYCRVIVTVGLWLQ